MGKIMYKGIEYSDGGGNGNIVELTLEEYNALSEEEQNNNTLYFITDVEESTRLAENISYDNANSGLSSTDVQNAIDEINNHITYNSSIEEVVITFGTNTNTANNYIITIPFLNSDKYAIELTKANVLGGSSVLTYCSVPAKSKFGFTIACSSSAVSGKAVNFGFSVA